jgi:hypothetical protein
MEIMGLAKMILDSSSSLGRSFMKDICEINRAQQAQSADELSEFAPW